MAAKIGRLQRKKSKSASSQASKVLKAAAKSAVNKVMAAQGAVITGKWHKHNFKVSPNKILTFGDLKMTGSCETKDKKKSGQGYVAKKKGKPTEISVTIELNAYLGASVRKEVDKFVEEARSGAKDYFYIGKNKLVPYKLMLTNATTKSVEISHNNTWVSAQLTLTMKQCEKKKSTKKKSVKRKKRKNRKNSGYSGSSYGSSGGSGSSTSSWSGSSTKRPVTSPVAKTATRVNRAFTTSAVRSTSRITSSAKRYSIFSKS